MTNQPPLNPDALAQLIMWKDFPFGGNGSHVRLDANAAHAVINLLKPHLAVAQPLVNSVEELDQLPMHTYVQGNDGFKHAKDWSGGWHLIVNRPSSTPHLSGSIELPARVLYRPEVNDA